MATPNPVDSALEAYRAKLIKANTGEVEKKFRKAFPEATGEQIIALGRQGMLQRLMELKKAELAKLVLEVFKCWFTHRIVYKVVV